MNPSRELATPPSPSTDASIDEACGRIAPTWPLDRFIAVNPYWGSVDMPMPAAGARLAALSGTRLLMPRAWYRNCWRAGQFNRRHLERAIAEAGTDWTIERLLDHLDEPPALPACRPLLTDVVAALRDPVHEMPLATYVVHNISQVCASFFDEGQAQLTPQRQDGLYATWQRYAERDRSPRLLFRLKGFRAIVTDLPRSPRALIGAALTSLHVPGAEQANFLNALLLSINGWAAWCAYRRWEARLAQRDDDSIVELLAIRLAWEWILYRCSADLGIEGRWQAAISNWPVNDAACAADQSGEWLLQRAFELAEQEEWCRKLATTTVSIQDVRPAPRAQAAFCIDVRSEVFRRALEAVAPDVRTLGFAGFFGLPIDYRPLGAISSRPQLPGLLAPSLHTSDCCEDPRLAGRRQQRLGLQDAWGQFRSGAASTFSFVETSGLFYAFKLLADQWQKSSPVPRPVRAGLTDVEASALRPGLTLPDDSGQPDTRARAQLAAGILGAMSLTRGFARLVLLAGHGSETVNNPHAAGLDCGACGGQTGEVNARVLAGLLNDPAVRQELGALGITVPGTTHFIAGLHTTTTDKVALFDQDQVPDSHRHDVAQLAAWLAAAGERTRRERAPALGLGHLDDHDLLAALEHRARNWAEVRPEWGLANNAAFIIAPRERTRGLDLGGRSFLHDYCSREDPDLSILELVMTAPMVVTHWINMQYYASTVDNARYGSGNKVLHNVVGGHLGVFEGNGGDLRIGLPLQSLHDGQDWRHTPVRLNVFIEATREAIERVLERHASVRALVENQWLFLFQLDPVPGTVSRYRQGAWSEA